MLETRVSGSRPGWGIIFVRNTGVNQHGEPVISFVSSVFVERRDEDAGLMTVAGGQPLDPHAANLKRDERRAAGVACGAHALHDGYTDLIYVMLPVWQKEFGLGYAELGLLRGLFSGTMAGFQIPAGLIAERLGAAAVLALGTALAGAGYCLAGASAGFGLLMVALFIAGLGSSTQHPLASSLMAHAYAGPRSMKALGTYNFAGDIGKMTVPAALSLLLVVMPWRPALALLGALGVLAAAAIFLLMPRYGAGVRRGCRKARTCDDALIAPRSAAPLSSAIASRSRCCWRSACSTVRPAWDFCCSCRSCSRPRAPACPPSGWR